ncbi:MAG: phenylalanine--tRNA ligase subunit alpha [Candidatus Cardinium sp.]|uniref:phenylalanine--tRNA ligase subunit alpha n=1 Tax=Cardinium endosymbiont of Dermatophagoides farinae TaxID=2597823 RepID=UPI0011840E08|nr:phenylalanine--tRNA ligase subunit alpha [Cardinium endosymbiont of Dermatophagoides farinae]TSJ81404.1 phenylalanine--tRNA ligase subunit alpha [Cardinium endosymbiont of Dermatophagoides farinae]UWW97466.1 MAG: phenylalanine--tRNA ligase subunit alpha [Candidatus Cardinium sp.]
MMMDRIAQLREKIESVVIKDKATLESFRRDFISKKGSIAALFEAFRQLPTEAKKAMGPALNGLKEQAEKKFKHAASILEAAAVPSTQQPVDGTLPAFGATIGSLHPLTIVQNKIISIFQRIGFNLAEGPEIVGDWHNFTALNFPENHPARDMQDTFFVQRNPDQLLRTHTTSVQISTCTAQAPPIRSIAIGRVFRKEAISARSHCFFHQVDGMYIHTDVTFSDLKGTIYHFVEAMFGPATKLRFRASYFPFTEPSAEVDINCRLCQGKGCTVCKYSGWVEILGAGMIDPNVLTNCHIDPEQYSGFAFGMGIERIAMLHYQIDDLRLFSENHLAFLRQFTAC